MKFIMKVVIIERLINPFTVIKCSTKLILWNHQNKVLNLGPNHKNDMFGQSKILSSVIQMRNLKLFFPILISSTSQDIEIDFDNIEVDFESSGYGEIVTETTTITTITSKTIINAGIETIIPRDPSAEGTGQKGAFYQDKTSLCN